MKPTLRIHELPTHPNAPFGLHVLRHWLTLADGRIFYQDETISHRIRDASPNAPLETESVRGDWHQLATPPATVPVVGMADYGGIPMALRADGATFLLAHAQGSAGIDSWVPFAGVPNAPVED
jgi:hypothetical protein